MKILITGVQGFVGRNLSYYFSAAGHTVFAPEVAELDLRDEPSVARYLAAHPVDAVVHCATTLRADTAYPPDTCEFNLRMFFNLEKNLAPSVKLVNLGSGSEYSRAYWHRKMPESFFGTHVPKDSHSYAKYLISKYIDERNRDDLFCLRIFGIYGKYEDYRYKFISNAIVKNLLGLPIVINQNVIYDYISVEDFARLVEVLLLRNVRGRCFNVTPTESIDLVTLANLINEVSDRPVEVQVLNEGIGVEYTGDNSALMAEIEDFSFTPPMISIGDLYGYYKNIKAQLDYESVKADAYLNYAKSLRESYFRKS